MAVQEFETYCSYAKTFLPERNPSMQWQCVLDAMMMHSQRAEATTEANCRHENPQCAGKSVIPYINLVCMFILYNVVGKRVTHPPTISHLRASIYLPSSTIPPIRVGLSQNFI